MTPTEPKAGNRVKDVTCSDDELTVVLVDGRRISVPIAWYPRLLHATAEQRANWVLAGAGYGIHWPDLDEDLSINRPLRGTPASRKSTDSHPAPL